MDIGDRVVGDGRLLERERELGAIDGLLTAACERAGGLLVLEGEAGVGKSRLLAAASGLASDRGMRVLAARGEELELTAPWGLAGRLLPPGAAGGDEVLAIAHALFWRIADLAEQGGLLLSVDDAQWADDESLRLLGYLLARVADVRVAVLMARRSGEPGPRRPLLDLIAADPRTRRLTPAPLSVDAVGVLVAEMLGAGAENGVVEACAEMTRGNPFYLRELLLELVKLPQRPLGAGAVRRIAPESVSRAVFVRLGSLTPSSVALARAVAVFGDGAAFPHAVALAQLDGSAGAHALDELAGAEILRPREPLGFVHPLVAEAIYRDIAVGERGESHRRAAGLLARDGAESAQVAVHLMRAGRRGDEWVVETLCAAAAGALGRGATEVAA
ncbi:MAG: AAA family ATPase, partial [Solirubrobacteraceae bacterium]